MGIGSAGEGVEGTRPGGRPASRTGESPLQSFESELEQAIAERPDSIHGLANGPRRFNIEAHLRQGNGPGAWRRWMTWMLLAFPYFQAMRRDIARSFTSIDENPPAPKKSASPDFLSQFEGVARSLGADAIGYTDVPPQAWFQGKAGLYRHAIVLLKEMDPEKIARAPSRRTFRMVMKSYYDLGRIVTRLADYLRQHGYGVQGGHPLNGVALYPLLAQQAGLGWVGMNGLLIAPRFGPRHRLAALYTSIENLPATGENEHAWIADFCTWCGQCRRKCPGQAIYEEPASRPPGIVTHVDVDRCFPVFAKEYGCSVCIKVCPFNRHPYRRIRDRFLRCKSRQALPDL